MNNINTQLYAAICHLLCSARSLHAQPNFLILGSRSNVLSETPHRPITVKICHLIEAKVGKAVARWGWLCAVAGLVASLVAPVALHAEAVEEKWVNRYNGPTNTADRARRVAVDGSGNVIVTGVSEGLRSSQASGEDFYTAKYASADGALLWEVRFDQARLPDQVNAIAVDSSGNVVVAGYARSVFTSRDYYTAKYAAANGTLLWGKYVNGGSNSDDEASAVVVDANGNVIVTGYVDDPLSGRNFYTGKYAAANGALLWGVSYNGPGNSDDRARAIAVDGSGNVIVTGTLISSSGSGDYYTAKYAAATGARLWEVRYNGPANGDDNPSAVVVDGSGNATVTGTSAGSGSAGDYYTAKYAAANGALLWEMRYNGPVNGDDSAAAAGLDGNGNVIVTGTSAGGGSGGDYYTAKYGAADGALLWQVRYNGPGNGDDSARAVVLDGSGNPIVTGASVGSGSGSDHYTAKYAATNGSVLWEKRFHWLANGEDMANAAAVDGSANVIVAGSSAGDGTGDDYVTIKYGPLGPTSLASLVLSAGPLNPAFNSATISYTATVPNAVASVTVTPTASDATSTVEARVNGGSFSPVLSGSPSMALGVNVGANAIEMKVTSQDGTATKTYMVAVTRLVPSTSANLSGLAISAGTLNPAFNAGTTSYAASVSDTTASLTVTPTAGDANATIEVRVNGGNFIPVVNGSTSIALGLNVGANPVEVKVTAEDAVTTKTYTVTVTRPGTAMPGDLDLNFGSVGRVVTDCGGIDQGLCVRVQVDGKILLAGYSLSPGYNFAISRYEATGALDTDFGTAGVALTPFGGGEDDSMGMAVQSDGKVILAGEVDGDFVVARYQSTGVLDTSFGTGGIVVTDFYSSQDEASTVVIQSDGKIIVGAHTEGSGGNASLGLVRYTPTGALDLNFGTSGKVTTSFIYGEEIVLQTDGKLLVAGWGGNGPNFDFGLARFTESGTLDRSFGTGGEVTADFGEEASAYGLALQSDGKILVAGELFNTSAGNYDFGLVRFTGAGVLDTSFGTGGRVTTPVGSYNDHAQKVAVQANGKIVVAGYSETEITDPLTGIRFADFAVLRYTNMGALDTSFGAGGKITTDFFGFHDYGYSVALQSDGKIVVGGYTHSGNEFGVQSEFALARYEGGSPGDADSDGLPDAWELTYWPTIAGHPGDADFDLDGVPELIELAFGLNPTVPDAASLPQVGNEGGYLTMTITKLAGVAYEVQSAGTLEAGRLDSFSPATTTILIDNASTLKARDNSPVGSPPARFMRVRVIAAP